MILIVLLWAFPRLYSFTSILRLCLYSTVGFVHRFFSFRCYFTVYWSPQSPNDKLQSGKAWCDYLVVLVTYLTTCQAYRAFLYFKVRSSAVQLLEITFTLHIESLRDHVCLEGPTNASKSGMAFHQAVFLVHMSFQWIMWLFPAGRLIRFHGSTRNVKKGMKCFSSSGLSSFDSQTAYPKDYRNEVNARWNQTITTGLLWSIVHKLGFSVHRLYCFYENEICYDEPRRYSALKSLCVPNEGLNGRLMMRQSTQVCFPEGKFSSKRSFEVFRSSPYNSPPWKFSLQKLSRPVVTYKCQFWIGICYNNERRRKLRWMIDRLKYRMSLSRKDHFWAR